MAIGAGFPHGAMRRSEREITDRRELEDILRATKIMHLAMAVGNVPFLVPLYFAFDGTAIYFHSARSGTKIELLKQNARVCFEMCDYLGVEESELPCDFEARHRTVIGTATACFVTDEKEKIKALDLILARFTPKHFSYSQAKLDATMVVRLDIDSLKGKMHGI